MGEGTKGARHSAYQAVSMLLILNQKKTTCGREEAGEIEKFDVNGVKFSVLPTRKTLEAGGSTTSQASWWPWLMVLFAVTAYSSDNGAQLKRQDH
jgi:hypothetical protein